MGGRFHSGRRLRRRRRRTQWRRHWDARQASVREPRSRSRRDGACRRRSTLRTSRLTTARQCFTGWKRSSHSPRRPSSRISSAVPRVRWEFARLEWLSPVVEALEERFVPVESVAPAALLAAQELAGRAGNQSNSADETAPGILTLLLLGEGDQANIVAMRGGRAVSWGLTPATIEDVRLQIDFVCATFPPRVPDAAVGGEPGTHPCHILTCGIDPTLLATLERTHGGRIAPIADGSEACETMQDLAARSAQRVLAGRKETLDRVSARRAGGEGSISTAPGSRSTPPWQLRSSSSLPYALRWASADGAMTGRHETASSRRLLFLRRLPRLAGPCERPGGARKRASQSHRNCDPGGGRRDVRRCCSRIGSSNHARRSGKNARYRAGADREDELQ